MYNQIYDFVTANSCLLITLLFSLIGLFIALLNKKKQEVYASIPILINSAEKLEYSNDAKFKSVLKIAYDLIPGIFKIFISEQDIARAVQYTFSKLKEYSKEQARQEAIKAIAMTAKNNIADELVTGTQQAAEISNNTSETKTS